MLKKLLLPAIFLILAYGFWVSPDFKDISAGVAIFLFGMLSLEQGFRAFTGGILEKILQRSTSRLWNSLSFGIISTTLMQSSSLVSVITISFLSAGLISLAAGIGIIFGANLGTTTGAWLIAGLGLKVKISAYAMPMLVFGVILLFQESKAYKGIGYILTGLGFLFLGIHFMKEGFEAFKATIDLARFSMTGYPGLFLFTGLGILATFVMQSSHATLVLIITGLAAQQVTYENALALAIGANIGTTITAIIGSMSANVQGKRLAGAHLIFNAVTGLIAILFIHQLVETVDTISHHLGIHTTDYTLKLAVFHTLFNLIGIIVMLPLISPMITLLEWLFKEKKLDIDQPKFLISSALDFPDTTVKVTLQETQHIFDNALNIIIHSLGFRKEQVFSEESLEDIASHQNKITRLDIDAAYTRGIKGIYSAIIEFISKANFSWQAEQSGELHHLRQANQHIVEAIKDIKHLQKNMLVYVNGEIIDMRMAYNLLRIEIATIIRDLNEIRVTEDKDTDILSLDALKLLINESQNAMNLEVSKLIRAGRISPSMGTSLMNDNAYAYDISSNLIRAAETLYIGSERAITKAARAVTLDDQELQTVAAQATDQPTETPTGTSP